MKQVLIIAAAVIAGACGIAALEIPLLWLGSVVALLFAGALAYPSLEIESEPKTLESPTAPSLPAAEEPPDDAHTAEVAKLMATMSHEIRTPLNGVIGMVEILIGTRLNEEQRKIANTIYDSGQVLSQVVDDYLAFYRMEAGESVVSVTSPCDLEETILHVTLLFQGMAYDKGLDLVFSCESSVPKVVQTDGRRLSQVVANLVLNAIKYTHEGEVAVSLERHQDQIIIAVSDTGAGIDKDELPDLFKPFRRLESSIGTKGTGLGLSITAQLVEALGGTLRVESERGAGTTFSASFEFESLVEERTTPETAQDTALIAGAQTGSVFALAEFISDLGIHTVIMDTPNVPNLEGADIAFVFSDAVGESAQSWAADAGVPFIEVLWLSDPRTHSDEAPNVLIRPFASHTVSKALVDVGDGAKRTSTVDIWRESFAGQNPLRIVIGEDDPVTGTVLTEMFRRLGYEPQLADTGPKALTLIQSVAPDVAFLDLNMPGYGGLEVVKNSDLDVWWVAMSASGGAAERRECRDAGMREFLMKPFSIDALRGALLRASARGSVADARPSRREIEKMKDLFADAPEAYAQLIRTQIAQTDLLCKDIVDHIDITNADSPGRLAAHTLRSSAATLGCNGVARQAEILDVEWESLDSNSRLDIAKRLQDAWHQRERQALVDELESVSV